MDELTLNDMEISAIGEVSNISLGNAATALGILLRDDIDISVPNVLIKNKGDIVSDGKACEIITRVNYVKGIQGYSILMLKTDDVKMMTDLMMGSDGHGMFFQQDLSDLHLSAVSEAMNQMMGSAATAMGIMLDRLVDISTPETIQMNAGDYIQLEFPNDDKFVEIAFDVKLGKEIKCNMVQMYPYTLAKAIADLFIIRKKNEEANA